MFNLRSFLPAAVPAAVGVAPRNGNAKARSTHNGRATSSHGGNGAGKGNGPNGSKSIEIESNLPRVFSIADLPTVRKILTVQGGAYELPAGQRENCVAIVADNGHVWVLVEPAFYQKTTIHVSGLRERMRKDGLTIDKTVLAEKDLISGVYDTAQRLHEAAQFEQPVTEEGKLFHELVEYGWKYEASDLHCEIRGQHGYVRYRIDGDLEPMRNANRGVYTMEQLRDAVAYAYNHLQSDSTGSHGVFNPQVDQYCQIPYRIGKDHINLRYQSFKEWKGFDAVVRLIPQEERMKVECFQDLGFADYHATALEIAARSTKGMILLAGIPGSGKSTTAKMVIQTMPNRAKKKIITVEDPVEFNMPGVSQTSHQRSLDGSDSAGSMQAATSVFMRADPDTIMQGEIRDQISGESAQVYLETGLQVLATVHAQSVFGVFPRLLSPKIGFSLQTLTTPQYLALVVYMALVPKLCTECRIPAEKEIPATLAFIRDRFNIDTSGMYVKNPEGCACCNHRGTKGRTAVAEVLVPDRQILKLIRNQDEFAAEELWRSRSDRRFDTPEMEGKTVFEHALYKAFLGQIDIQAVETFEAFERFEILGSNR